MLIINIVFLLYFLFTSIFFVWAAKSAWGYTFYNYMSWTFLSVSGLAFILTIKEIHDLVNVLEGIK